MQIQVYVPKATQSGDNIGNKQTVLQQMLHVLQGLCLHISRQYAHTQDYTLGLMNRQYRRHIEQAASRLQSV